jgi:hypothetical protein
VIIAAVDPGRTIGLARVPTTSSAPLSAPRAEQLTDPMEAFKLLVSWYREWPLSMIIVEDYVGGGVQSSDGLYTAKLTGFFYYAGLVQGLPVQLRVPQKRLAGLSRAKQDNYPVHATDALAHCYAEIRRERLK